MTETKNDFSFNLLYKFMAKKLTNPALENNY